jgi:hypothetical protein
MFHINRLGGGYKFEEKTDGYPARKTKVVDAPSL